MFKFKKKPIGPTEIKVFLKFKGLPSLKINHCLVELSGFFLFNTNISIKFMGKYTSSKACKVPHIYIVASELKDPICHSNECQIGSFSSEATIYGAGNKMIDPHVILTMPFNFIVRNSHLYYPITQFVLWQCHLT